MAQSMNGNTSQTDANDTNHAEATESSTQTKTAAQQRARNQQKTQCTEKDANKPEKQHDGHGNCACTSARINIVVCSKYAAKFWSATFSHKLCGLLLLLRRGGLDGALKVGTITSNKPQ